MLTTPLSVQSTLLEGFTANGSISYRSNHGYNFDPAYTSHAHGWSSGATSALTFYVLGLTVTSPQGLTWQVAPQPGGLTDVEGGFETGLGWFGVKWMISGGGKQMQLQLDTPVGTSGTVVVPSGFTGAVTMDGKAIANVSKGVNGSKKLQVQGGKHVVMARTV